MVPQLISKLDIHVLEIDRLLGSLSANQLNFSPGEGKWSIRQQLAHLGRYHEIFKERIRRIKHEDTPLFTRYRAEWDPGYKDWEIMHISVLKERIESLRSEIKEELLNTSPNILMREGKHPRLGTMTLESWLEFFVLHESHHLYSIFRIVKQHLSPSSPSPSYS